MLNPDYVTSIVEDMDVVYRSLLESSKRQDGTPALNAQAINNRALAQTISGWMRRVEAIKSAVYPPLPVDFPQSVATRLTNS